MWREVFVAVKELIQPVEIQGRHSLTASGPRTAHPARSYPKKARPSLHVSVVNKTRFFAAEPLRGSPNLVSFDGNQVA